MALKILLKFPTKSRPAKFLQVLSDYIAKASDNTNICYLISIDSNDATMTTEVQQKARELHPHVFIFSGTSKSKIAACNRDIYYIQEWDILVLGSDDMICQARGWDDQIRKDMQENFPLLDGVLYYPDGYTQLNTMCIMGKRYYDRFGYIYNPSYTSLFCDDEFMQVSRILGKEYKSDKILFKHEHPVWTGAQRDELLNRNEAFYKLDEKVFKERKAMNFGLQKVVA